MYTPLPNLKLQRLIPVLCVEVIIYLKKQHLVRVIEIAIFLGNLKKKWGGGGEGRERKPGSSLALP